VQVARNYRLTRHLLEASREVARIVVASAYMRDLLMEHGVPAEKVRVIPHPYVAHDIGEGAVGGRPSSILYVGRISPQKGVEYLVRAVARLEGRSILTLVGDGPWRPQAEKLAGELIGARHEVAFTGWLPHDQVRRLYRTHEVVALPSVWPEPFGRVGLEATGAGKPVVAFDVGGIREWLADGQNGFLVPPKDIEAFAAALRRLLLDEELRRRMGQNGVELARTRFDSKRHVDTMLALYSEILGGTR
jgi:glycosyltransferase involved in cell wall biosynthesis